MEIQVSFGNGLERKEEEKEKEREKERQTEGGERGREWGGACVKEAEVAGEIFGLH